MFQLHTPMTDEDWVWIRRYDRDKWTLPLYFAFPKQYPAIQQAVDDFLDDLFHPKPVPPSKWPPFIQAIAGWFTTNRLNHTWTSYESFDADLLTAMQYAADECNINLWGPDGLRSYPFGGVSGGGA